MSEAVATPPEVTPPVPATPPADVSKLEKDLADLRAQLEQKDQLARFWHKQASEKTPAEKPKAKEEEEIDLSDLIVNKGPKAFADYLKKQGFASAEEVDAKVNAKVAQINQEQELLAEFPELKDEKSDFFKAVTEEYTKLRGRMPEIEAMQMAAERADRKRLREEVKKKETESDRRSRAAAASGEGSRNSRQADHEEPDELDATQKMIAEKMGISEDAYLARAKKGVALGGRNALGMRK